jgi:hypothetical protein
MVFWSVELKCAEGIYSNARKGGRGESQKKGDRLDGDVRKEIQRIARVIVKERLIPKMCTAGIVMHIICIHCGAVRVTLFTLLRPAHINLGLGSRVKSGWVGDS